MVIFVWPFFYCDQHKFQISLRYNISYALKILNLSLTPFDAFDNESEKHVSLIK